jgi:hypothetical protein
LQTAAAFGLVMIGPTQDPQLMAAPSVWPEKNLQEILDQWLPLTVALNAVNRSMGRSDLYPFVLSSGVINKLAFVHAVVQAGSSSQADSLS